MFRCHRCDGISNLYSGTLFAGCQLRPSQAILLLQGVLQGKPAAKIAREIGLSRPTVQNLRRKIQEQAQALQPESPLPDSVTETDEMFQNAGEKGIPHRDPEDPPRRRANQQKGHGTYENDRPPVVGTVGRESGTLAGGSSHGPSDADASRAPVYSNRGDHQFG